MGAGDSCERIRRFPGKRIGKTESGGRPSPKRERQVRQLTPRSGTKQLDGHISKLSTRKERGEFRKDRSLFFPVKYQKRKSEIQLRPFLYKLF
ncbi:hypothetical protein NPIL_539281 [Nephila pilipes]|uniref:Uncharacterized protein n=1 Tax=Nephila pilipes TaxID=299642 RepID=A0A8X6NGK7_NEPPI|nr:hypothetical protein NPIL_539281 [Nephila pilipes]